MATWDSTLLRPQPQVPGKDKEASGVVPSWCSPSKVGPAAAGGRDWRQLGLTARLPATSQLRKVPIPTLLGRC